MRALVGCERRIVQLELREAMLYITLAFAGNIPIASLDFLSPRPPPPTHTHTHHAAQAQARTW